ncbi:MAG: TonB-dependent receptor [Bacteroidota bacterium]
MHLSEKTNDIVRVVAYFLLWMCRVMILPAQTDSVVYLDQVEIFGEPVDKYLAGTTIQTIKPGPTGALNQLSEQSAIYFKEYGNGQLATITLRGTSASHTNVLWNGLPVNSPTLGQTDFTVWPMFLVDQLAVQKGSGSSTFGSGAIGGSIILDNSVIQPDSLITLYSAFGSFGQWDFGASTQLYIGKLKSETRLYKGTIRNDFPYELRGVKVRQKHASVERLGLSQRINLTTKHHFLFSEIAYVENDRQIQPTISSASRDVLRTENLRFLISDEVFSANFTQFLSLGYAWDQTVFNETSVTASHQLIGNYAIETQVGKSIIGRLGVTAQDAWANAENYTETEKQKQLHLFSSWNFNLFSRVLLSLNLREAIHEDQTVFVPSIGGEWVPIKNFNELKVRGQASKGYRVPTFNDLFWNPGCNPELSPELSMNYEAGIDWASHSFSLSVTGFTSRVDEWIQWVPTEGVWSPQNIRNVEISGLESTLSKSFPIASWKVAVQTNYEYTRSRDLSAEKHTQLPYVPKHSFFMQLGVTGNKRTSITGRWNYTSQRFTTLSNTSQGRIDDFGLFDLIFRKSFTIDHISLTAQLATHNLLDMTYENVINTAMPGRNYRIELTINY